MKRIPEVNAQVLTGVSLGNIYNTATDLQANAIITVTISWEGGVFSDGDALFQDNIEIIMQVTSSPLTSIKVRIMINLSHLYKYGWF